MRSGNILPIFILTIIIPILCFFILKNLGIVKTIFLTRAEERKYPLMISLILLLMILLKVIPDHYTQELYFFFLGLIAATSTSLLLLLIPFKTSLHMMGVGSILMFLIALSIHFERNIVVAISLMFFASGLVASSRLFLKAHSRTELLIGFMIGVVSQLLTLKFWL
jgi:membrane-associated phospholipid phosphatase